MGTECAGMDVRVREREREREVRVTHVVGDDAGAFVETKLVHNPVGFLAVRGAPLVEHQRLAHADHVALRVNRLVATRGLPEARRGGAVRSVARRILLVLVTEKVPVALRLRRVVPNPAHLCSSHRPMHHIINATPPSLPSLAHIPILATDPFDQECAPFSSSITP